MKQKSKNSGFTLVELIVVVAILAVVAAVIVPSYIQYVEKARRAVCESNREEFIHQYEIGLATNINDAYYYQLMESAAASTGMTITSREGATLTIENGCSTDGIFTLKYNVDTGAITTFECSVHEPDMKMGGFEQFANELKGGSSELFKFYEQYANSLLGGNGSSLDYPLPESSAFVGASTKIMQEAAKYGIDISSGSWRIYCWSPGDYSFYYTSEDVSQLKAGESVTVTRVDFGKNNGVYTGTSVVTEKKVNNVSYNVMGATSQSNMTKK